MADQVNLRLDGEADFIINKDDQIVDYDDVRNFAQDEDADAATERFEFTCANCQSTNCRVDDQVRMGSSWTGLYGEMSIECRDCKAYRTIWSP